MAITDKDKMQKQRSVRFCIANRLIPYLEVKVFNDREVSDNETTLTDIDVMGIEVAPRSKIRRVIFDCKTLKTSPINRAFWAAGVAKYILADESFVILEKRALESHRLSANNINVHLFDNERFDRYAESKSVDYLNVSPYSVDIDVWYQYLSLFESNKKILNLGDYINHRVPLELDHSKAMRGILAIARKTRGEIDPEKKDHMSIYAAIVMSLCFTLAPIAIELSEVFEAGNDKGKFEDSIKYYIWGGRESFLLRRKLKELLSENSSQTPAHAEIELANWDEFLELLRLVLQAPTHLSLCCLPLREISLRYLSDVNSKADQAIANRLNESNRIRQFIFKVSSYLVNATGLPRDCDTNLRTVINQCLTQGGK